MVGCARELAAQTHPATEIRIALLVFIELGAGAAAHILWNQKEIYARILKARVPRDQSALPLSPLARASLAPVALGEQKKFAALIPVDLLFSWFVVLEFLLRLPRASLPLLWSVWTTNRLKPP